MIHTPAFLNKSEPKPLPETDPRFPGLRFVKGNPKLKKTDPGYKDRIVTDDDLAFDIFAPTLDPALLQQGRQVELIDIQPFDEYCLRVMLLDMEWVGADGGPAKGDATDVIVAIGCYQAGRYTIGCNKAKTEEDLLRWFLQLLDLWDPHTIGGHAIYGFFKGDQEILSDLGLLAARLSVYGLPCPWKRSTKPDRWRWSNAKENGQSMEAPAWECERFELIDTLQQTALWDSIFSKLSGYGLKTAVREMGLVKRDDRLEIGAEVYKYWAVGDVETIKKYMYQDVEDVVLLFNKLIPAKYFQRAYLPMSLQRICTTGTGSWWNQYLRSVNNADYAPGYQVAAYQGAITFYYAGVWRDCVKLDFGAMYPNIIEWLQLCPHNDHEKMNAKTVAFVKRFRKQLQKQSREYPKGSSEFNNLDGQQSTAKVLANSDYGLFNTMGLQFNDPYVGAMITWAARQLARFVMQYCVDAGCHLVAIDTDGVQVYNPSLANVSADERKAFFRDLEQRINDALPANNYVEYEADIDFIWVPKVTGTKSVVAATQKGLDDKTAFLKNNPLHGAEVGLSKNYITMSRNADGTISTTKKGKFKKRNRSWLDKTFVETFLLKWFDQGLDVACDYYYEIRAEIEGGEFPLEKLQENVLVAKNWTTYEEWGFTLGEKYLTHYVYDEVASLTKAGKPRKHKQYKRTDDVTIPYSVDYYLDKIDELYMLLCGREPEDCSPATDHDQLQLFAA